MYFLEHRLTPKIEILKKVALLILLYHSYQNQIEPANSTDSTANRRTTGPILLKYGTSKTTGNDHLNRPIFIKIVWTVDFLIKPDRLLWLSLPICRQWSVHKKKNSNRSGELNKCFVCWNSWAALGVLDLRASENWSWSSINKLVMEMEMEVER